MKKLNFLKSFFLTSVGIFLIVNCILYLYCYVTPKPNINKNQGYYLYDSSGNLLLNNNKDWIALEKISPYLIDATINTEDKNFYNHLGFDFFRIGKAIIKNISSRSLKEGASTITQQYARNLFLNYDKTWSRKFDEAILAAELETHYSKDEILEGYLNTINYGGVYGIENASWYYFGHSASELNLAEASMLAGIPQSPSNNSPLVDLDKAKNRQNIVLMSMYNNKTINKKDMDDAFNLKLTYVGKTIQSDLENILYFRDAVVEELNNINTIPKALLDTSTFKIYTTLDINAQKSLEEAVENNMNDSEEIQVAGLMMNPNNGGILAMIGGYDYSVSQFNRAVNSKRQVGSTIKPILYYSALENGFTASSSFTSEKTTFNFSGKKTYTPSNYNELYANSAISMGAAIAYSDNIYAVKTHLFLGENNLVNISNRLGIESNLQAIPSLALGTEEIGMVELVESYSSFANMGYKIESHFIEKIEDENGNILYDYKKEKELILNSNLTFILNEMLTYTYDSSFIDYNYPTVINLLPKITNKYAIKTGTTDTDLWIVGYNKNAVLSIWNGYDDNKLIEQKDKNYHKNIWIDTMEVYLSDKDNSWYDIPKNVVGTLVNPITGKLATENDSNSKIFYFLKGTEPATNNVDLETVFKEENESAVGQ